MSPHDCDAEGVEEATSPTASGYIVVTERCGICGNVLRTYPDSIL